MENQSPAFLPFWVEKEGRNSNKYHINQRKNKKKSKKVYFFGLFEKADF
ncbi:MAG: hypothetical protein K2G44_00220 [Clostridia bacterium]|nr:hypothetical protein [Clostridia bacterium]